VRRGLAALVCLALISVAGPASAAEIYPIVFPIAGEYRDLNNFGAPRGGGRTHIGTDIAADKMTPVVAAADGVVGWMSSTCCALKLVHDDGYESWYIHLNNDTPGTDDGLGWGYAPGIEMDVRVSAGQHIGWVGDSGNAENTLSHLHFELHNLVGPFNPRDSLLAATHIDPVAADEIFFYREDGLFRYYDIKPDAALGSPLAGGTGYTTGWSTITSINLDGDGDDEMFFYRTDGLFRYYDVKPDGSLPKPFKAGSDYTAGWSSITAVDLDGDGRDEIFFYREDGLFRFYDIRPNGDIGSPLVGGSTYTQGWDAITAVDIDGDGQDELFFYRDDGIYRFYHVKADGSLPTALSAGSDYESGWTSIRAIDLSGDQDDEMLFYREDGTFGFYPISDLGARGEAILSGAGYTTGWNSIASVNLDG
jgi:hypothetical protein